MLDLGANVDSSPENLVEFAIMGTILAKAVDGIAAPKLGLLNIGSEAIKGNEQVKKTSALLAAQPGLNFVGNIEGDQIYLGDIDVIVCDGFVGNVALKTSEGAIQLILHYLRSAFNQNKLSRMVGVLAKPILRQVKARIDPTNYNGASLVGLKGIVVKSHGGASVPAFANAIEEAVSLVAQNIPEKIHAGIAAGLLNKQDLA
jgi:glycerol-3-phosphate acyltransferase PlsX